MARAPEAPDPFLEDRHRQLAEWTRTFGDRRLRAFDEADPAERSREIVALLAGERLLEAAIPAPYGTLDRRSLVVVRESLAYFSAHADAAFATQALAAYALGTAGSEIQKKRWLPELASGSTLGALALTEPEAGSDLAAIRTQARLDGAAWRLDGVKTLIANAGCAGVLTVLARSSKPARGEGLSLFLVDAAAPGLRTLPLEPMAPQPLGEVSFESTPAALLGAEGSGYALALEVLAAVRPSLAAALCGLAARALDEALSHALARRQFGKHLAELDTVQLTLGRMHVALESARLLARRAAWLADHAAPGAAREAAAARAAAGSAAQQVIDAALELHGGQGILRGTTVERLYREVRSLRLYDGAGDLQLLAVARDLLRGRR